MEVKETVDKYLTNLMSELEVFSSDLSVDSLNQAKEIIKEAESNGGRIHISGIGKPGHLAGYIASLMSSTGTPAYFLDGTEAIHGSSGQVKPGDVVIAISNSGETEELKKTILTLQANGAQIITVTGKESSWLAKNSDCSILAGVSNEGDSLNKPPRASIAVEMVSLQLLSLILQEEKNISAQEYVKWHPGGALGKSIKGN